MKYNVKLARYYMKLEELVFKQMDIMQQTSAEFAQLNNIQKIRIEEMSTRIQGLERYLESNDCACGYCDGFRCDCKKCSKNKDE